MPNREKWADFVRMATVHMECAQRGGHLEAYAKFQCPYQCGVCVQLPEANVKNNKSTECYKHLMKCSGVASDGRAAHGDPRVAAARQASSEAKVHMKLAKRGRVEGQASAVDTSVSLAEELAQKDTRLRAYESNEQRLVIRTTSLQGGCTRWRPR